MGWLGSLWGSVRGSTMEDLVLLRDLTGPGEPIEPDGCYITLVVESFRLKASRRFADRFHGVVYTFSKLSREGEPTAELAAVSKPQKLANLDEGSLGRVITVSKEMMRAIAWRGGSLHLELGLFSVRSGNVLEPVTGLLSDMSDVAGIGFVGQMAPFVPLLTKGMHLIAGQSADTQLVVAVDTDLRLERSGVYAIVDVPKGSIDAARITVDADDMKLLLDGAPLEEGYCVFSVRADRRKVDFGDIPSLSEGYAALRRAMAANDQRRATEALTAFRLAVLTSPDLIPADAAALVEKVTQRMRSLFPGGPQSRSHAAPPPERLADVDLYGAG